MTWRAAVKSFVVTRLGDGKLVFSEKLKLIATPFNSSERNARR